MKKLSDWGRQPEQTEIRHVRKYVIGRHRGALGEGVAPGVPLATSTKHRKDRQMDS